MKKRMLSTLLTLGMLLTLTPAVLAEVPEGSAGDIPEETCKVEYKEPVSYTHLTLPTIA